MNVIKGEATGLPIPANAEIAIEGWSMPGETMIEGPFGEWTGYYGSSPRPEPYVDVKAIYYRNDPIILGCPPGKPPVELDYHRSFIISALIMNQMAAAGVPDVKGVWSHEAGGGKLFIVVSIKQRYPGHAKQAAMVATNCAAGGFFGRYTIVVDDDIDPSNLQEVIWAISTRSDPENDIDIQRRCWSSALDMIIPVQKRGLNSRAIIDACKPYEWIKDFPPVAEVSREYQKQIEDKWGSVL